MVKLAREEALGHAASIDQGTNNVGCTHAEHVVEGDCALSHSKLEIA